MLVIVQKLKNLLSAYGATAAGMVVGVLTTALLTRLLPVETFGAWSQFKVSAGLCAAFLSLNLGHGFLRFASGASADARARILASILTLQGLLILVALLVLSPWRLELSTFLFGVEHPWLLTAVAVFAALSLFQVGLTNALFARQQAPLAYGLTAASRALALGGAGVVLFFPSLWGVILATTCSVVLSLLLFIIAVRQDLRLPRIELGRIKEILAFCMPLLPVQLAVWVCSSSDRLFLKHYIGLEAVAHYSLVYVFAHLITTIYTSAGPLFLSSVVRWYEEGALDRTGRAFDLALTGYWTAGLAVLAGFVIGAPVIVEFVSGPEYLFEGLQGVVGAVCAGGFLYGLYQLFSRLFDLAKRPWTISGIWLGALLANLALNAWLIPSLGVVGAAAATALSYGISMGVALLVRPRVVPLSVRAGSMLLHGAMVSGLVTLTVMWGPSQPVGQVLAAVGVGLLVIVLALAVRVVDYAAVKEEWLSR